MAENLTNGHAKPPRLFEAVMQHILKDTGPQTQIAARIRSEAPNRLIWSEDAKTASELAARLIMAMSLLEDAIGTVTMVHNLVRNQLMEYARSGQIKPLIIELKRLRPAQADAIEMLRGLGLPESYLQTQQTGPRIIQP